MRIALTRQQHSSRIKSRNAYMNKSRAIGYAAIIIAEDKPAATTLKASTAA